jgi:hypothetical protein
MILLFAIRQAGNPAAAYAATAGKKGHAQQENFVLRGRRDAARFVRLISGGFSTLKPRSG